MKYVTLFVAAFALLMLTEGCKLDPLKLIGIDLWPKKEKWDETGAIPKGKKTVCPKCLHVTYVLSEKDKSKAHTYATLRWGISIGGLIIILSSIAMGLRIIKLPQGIGGIVAGVLVLLACHFLTQFLIPLLWSVMVLLIVAISYVLYINKEVIKAAVRFGNVMKGKAGVDDKEIHKIADETQPKSVQKVLNPIVKKVA